FTCTGVTNTTYPFQQQGGNNNDAPLCFTDISAREFVVLSCKQGGNDTYLSVGTLKDIFVPPLVTQENCDIELIVYNVDTAFWSSPDDPNLDNLVSCTNDSLMCTFSYNLAHFGPITTCSDTFTYIVGGHPSATSCLPADTILYDTTTVIVFPTFSVNMDQVCDNDPDSVILNANFSVNGSGCTYNLVWSTGDTTSSITVPISNIEYYVSVTRAGVSEGALACAMAVDSIVALGDVDLDCSLISNQTSSCYVPPLPAVDLNLLQVSGCNTIYTKLAHTISNNRPGCIGDTLIFSRYYMVDFDGDTINTTDDRDTCIQLFKFVDSTSPVISCPANVTIQCSSSTLPGVTGSASATDNCDGSPLITFTNATVSGPCPQAYLIIRTWRATDNCGNESTCSQTITLMDNVAPTISCPSNKIIQCTASILPANTGSATSIDNCDGSPIITYSDVTSAGSCPQAYLITRTWTSADHCGNSSNCVQTITVIDNVGPVVSCPPNVTVQCTGNTLPANTGTATSTDNCDPTPVITSTDATVAGSCPQAYIITRTWKSTDACGNMKTCNQTITVVDNVGPAISCPADVTIECTASSLPANTGNATSIDNCDLSPTITSTDVIITGSCPQAYIITRTWKSADDCGNMNTCNQILTVIDNVAPSISCPGDVTIQCTASTLPGNTGTATSIDNCDLSPTITSTDVTTAGSCPQAYIITRTWISADDCGNMNTCNQIITVIDNVAPSISCPGNVTIQCTASTLPANTGTATSTDNCDLSPAITSSDVTLAGSCPQAYIITRTWTSTDLCGNVSSCNQTISVIDNIAPIISCPVDITITYPASTDPSNTGTATASDLCDGSPVIMYTDSIPSQYCPFLNFIKRRWLATDACGNVSSCVQWITIEDKGTICGNVNDDFNQPIGGIQIQLWADMNSNMMVDAGDTLVTSTSSSGVDGSYCFTEVLPCNYVVVEIQPATYGSLSDEDATPDPDGDDSSDGPDDEIPVALAQSENDLDNNFVDIICPTVLPTLPYDTICSGQNVTLLISDLNLGSLTYSWNFGSGSTPGTGTGLGPHTISYVTTTQNQMNGASVVLTISKVGCPDLVGEVTKIDVNAYPNATINTSTASICYYTNKTFQPVAPAIPGATYNWTFDTGAVPATATGYGPHTVYYTTIGPKTAKLVIYPNEAGAQCPDSSTVSFTILSCPGAIIGFVKSVAGAGIPGVTVKLYVDANADGVADNATDIRNVLTNFPNPIGRYVMASLTPGSYVIVETQPAGWLNYDDFDASNDGDIMVNISGLDNLIPVTILPSEIDSMNNFIETPTPGNITGTVFEDFNNNLVPDTGEGLAAVVLNLYADDDQNGVADNGIILATTTTLADGSFAMMGIPVEDYVLIETDPANFISISDGDPTPDGDPGPNFDPNDNVIPVSITNNETDANNFFIDDRLAPLIVCPADLTLECIAITDPSSTGFATATDYCDGNITITYSDVTVEGECPQEFTILRTWSASDNCDNTSTCLQTIEIEDSTAPLITCPADVTILCTASNLPVNTGLATAIDICDPIVDLTYSDVIINGPCPQTYLITRTWQAFDDCGNVNNCLQLIQVIDNTPPTFTRPADITIFSDATCNFDASVAITGDVTNETDNCAT
ncbi:MAG TPA: prealbumin-like fold domain-containing protein, partial [Saprospiraceae bacterium]|nr:prealbumin-like fold domain-containing protein [Saprospiraceae bacterium]